jgi:transposase-like protein
MASKLICDRCGSDNAVIKNHAHYDNHPYDLCKDCRRALKTWFSRDNTTSPGDRVGWRQVCDHFVPCAGPCNSGKWERV